MVDGPALTLPDARLDTREKAAAPQFDVGPAGAVLNVHRLAADAGDARSPREAVARFTPQSLVEHDHATLQVSVLLRGSLAAVGWHTGGGRAAERRVRGGEVYVVPARQPHDFRLLRPEGMVNFHVDAPALAALAPGAERPFGLDELAMLDDPVIAGLAAGVHAACLAPDGLTPLYLDAAWTMLAVHLARRLGRAAPRRPAGGPAAGGQLLGTRRLRRVLAHVDAHVAKPAGESGDSHALRVSSLAAVAGLSPAHFTRLFTRATGTSPLQYVVGRRLEYARGLLARGQLPVAAVALEAGFGSPARFAEAFRRRYGVTPTESRRRARGW